MKICGKCKIKKSLDKFSSNKQIKDGKSSWCKECYNKTIIEYCQKYPWKETFHHIKTRCCNPNHVRYKNYGGRGIQCLITSEELKKLWFRDKAYLMKRPSIDRKENDGNYCYENCKYMEQGLNTAKMNRENKLKSINQFDLQENFIRNWKSTSEVQRKLGFNNSSISQVCNNKRKTAHGFIWKFVNEEDQKC